MPAIAFGGYTSVVLLIRLHLIGAHLCLLSSSRLRFKQVTHAGQQRTSKASTGVGGLPPLLFAVLTSCCCAVCRRVYMLFRQHLDWQLSRRGTAVQMPYSGSQLYDVLTAQQEADSSRPGTFMSQWAKGPWGGALAGLARLFDMHCTVPSRARQDSLCDFTNNSLVQVSRRPSHYCRQREYSTHSWPFVSWRMVTNRLTPQRAQLPRRQQLGLFVQSS